MNPAKAWLEGKWTQWEEENIEAHINDLTEARRATAGQPLSSKDRMHAAAAGRASEPSVGFGGNLIVPSWSSF